MAKRPVKNPIPKKPTKKSTVFQGDPAPRPAPSYEYNHKSGA